MVIDEILIGIDNLTYVNGFDVSAMHKDQQPKQYTNLFETIMSIKAYWID